MSLLLLRAGLLLVGVSLLAIEIRQSARQGSLDKVARWFLGALAVANIGLVVYLWFNHITFPLNLEAMEGTVLQHFQRAASGQFIYPEPTPEFVPLAYNPLYYLFSVPFGWAFGVNFCTLRLVAILGMLGSGLILYRVVQQKTGSTWWGLLAAGLFAAAYSVMDAYLDTAHSDSWLLCSALLGSYLIDRKRSRAWDLLGVVLLAAAFWFKQHGALLVIGGLLFLTWREGLRRSVLYWIVAALLGPVFYIFFGPLAFGPRFHYFTWEVPRRWSELGLGSFRRYIGHIVKYYPLLALSGGLLVLWTFLKERKNLNIWHFQFVFAALAGFMGTLDPGSADNVYVLMGTWFILVGTLALHQLATQMQVIERYRLHLFALLVSFVLLIYNPMNVLVSPDAEENYAELVSFLDGLDGTVYAPMLGQLQNGYVLYPAAHWVALEDMVRGPSRDTSNHPNTRRLLEPVVHPTGPAYLLHNFPLDIDVLLGFLAEYYVPEADLGDRFAPVGVLPTRYSDIVAWPRYLYRYAPEEAGQRGANSP